MINVTINTIPIENPGMPGTEGKPFKVVFDKNSYYPMIIGQTMVMFSEKPPEKPKWGMIWVNTKFDIYWYSESLGSWQPRENHEENLKTLEAVEQMLDYMIEGFVSPRSKPEEPVKTCDAAEAEEKYSAFEHAADLSGRLDIMKENQKVLDEYEKAFNDLLKTAEGKKLFDEVFVDNLIKANQNRVIYSTKRLDPPKYIASVDPFEKFDQ